MRSRLFLKIYLTLLASLAAVAVASAAFVWLGQGEEESGWQSQRPGSSPRSFRRTWTTGPSRRPSSGFHAPSMPTLPYTTRAAG